MAMLAVGMAVGCSRADPLGFTPVTGRVTFDGQPLERGEIRFSPDSAAGTNGPQSMSPLGPGGEFVLRGPGGRMGAVPGQHMVYLAMPEDGPPTPPSGAEATGVAAGGADAAPQAGLGMKKVPRRYLAAETAGLAATITPGEAARFDFEIVSTPPTK
jgi:hypothetical protein